MSKLIGNNPNQVPSNADLGSAAFVDAKDFLTSRGSSISAITAVIPKAALDVFIYDTSKDSDGGAWRKRTQHTSWYNEKLYTAKRGKRKEFPAVAIIVTRNTEVTIYDGDDPTLPMWMVFIGSQYSMISNTHNGITCATMKNGSLAVGSISGYNHGGISVVNFISDYAYLKTAGYTRSSNHAGISNRDSQLTGGDGTADYILNNNVRSLSMTVLPNAPIDSKTGIPVPTIGIATDHGVSVIKDDFTVVAISHTASTNRGAKDISFVGNLICYSSQQSGSSTNYWRRVFIEIPASNVTGAYTHNIPGTTIYDARGVSGNTPPLAVINNLGDATNNITDAVSDKAVGFSDKLTLLSVDDFPGVGGNPSLSSTSLAYIGKDYNTGWMIGDIKLVGLSNTEEVSSFHEYVEGYGDFTAGSEWTTNTGWSTSGNVATKTGGTGNNYISKSIGVPFVSGRWYQAEFDLLSGNGASVLLVNRHINGMQKPYTGSATNVDVAFFEGPEAGKYYAIWKQSSLNTGIISLYSGQSVSLDNLKVYEIGSEDRTTRFGYLLRAGNAHNIKRTPVASGAELMAYSGFAAGSVLAQPYQSTLDFGSGDYLISCWVNVDSNTTGSAEYYICRGYRGGSWTNHSFYLRQNVSTNYIEFGVTENGFSTRDIVQAPSAIPFNRWVQVTLVKSGGMLNLYQDGELVATNSVTRSHTNTQNGPLVIGDYGVGGAGSPIGGSIALVKISKTAPSPTQIKKTYEDEKALFQENAKISIYGNSGAVTSLAYDNDTELLHVGTSAGRSDFQGLRRINNTTRAIDTAISAADGFIVEE